MFIRLASKYSLRLCREAEQFWAKANLSQEPQPHQIPVGDGDITELCPSLDPLTGLLYLFNRIMCGELAPPAWWRRNQLASG